MPNNATPVAPVGPATVALVSNRPELSNWGHHKLMLAARKGAWWDANKIGLSPPCAAGTAEWSGRPHRA